MKVPKFVKPFLLSIATVLLQWAEEELANRVSKKANKPSK